MNAQLWSSQHCDLSDTSCPDDNGFTAPASPNCSHALLASLLCHDNTQGAPGRCCLLMLRPSVIGLQQAVMLRQQDRPATPPATQKATGTAPTALLVSPAPAVHPCGTAPSPASVWGLVGVKSTSNQLHLAASGCFVVVCGRHMMYCPPNTGTTTTTTKKTNSPQPFSY